MTRTARTDDQGQRDPAPTRQPGWLEPELATLTADRFSDPAWIFERKFDGERCLAFRDGEQLRLMTRNQQQVTGTYPEIAEALRGPGRRRLHRGRRGRGLRRAIRPASPGCSAGSGSAIRGRRCSPRCRCTSTCSTCCGPTAATCAPGRCWSARPLLRDLLSFGDPLRFTEHRDGDGEAYYHRGVPAWAGRR